MKKLYFLILFIFCFNILRAEEEEIFPYITRDRYKKLCRYFLDDSGFYVNPEGREDYWCICTNVTKLFFTKYAPKNKPFTLFSINSDWPLDGRFKIFYNNPQLSAWYGQNINYNHPKLKSLPIGLCSWADFATLKRVQENPPPKTRLVYANYIIRNNPKERQHCLDATGVPLSEIKPFEEFLKDMAGSYFVLSPNGNGFDCHRHWEALYLRSVPIVTRSMNVEQYKDLPFLIIDDWDDFKDLELTEELYESIMGDFDPSTLTVEYFLRDAD